MNKGFTLIELVVVMVMLAILAIGASSYLGIGATLFSEASQREQVLADGRFAAERVVRELRLAAPNSVRISSAGGVQCIEFAPVVSSGLYQNVPIAPASGSDVQLLHSAWQNAFLGLPFSIYPRQPADIYQFGGATLLLNGTLDADTDGQAITVGITLATAHQFPTSSPEQRFYLLAASPVSFCFNALAQQLRRYDNYTYQALQPLPPQSNGVLMAKNVAEVSFSNLPPALARNNVVNIVLRFAGNANADLFFNYEVHLNNVP